MTLIQCNNNKIVILNVITLVPVEKKVKVYVPQPVKVEKKVCVDILLI